MAVPLPSLNLATDSLGFGQMYESLTSLFGQKKNREANLEMARMNYDLQKTALQNQQQTAPTSSNNIIWWIVGALIILVIIILIKRR
jgi:hypothetical protein